jgi:hypothetical protein
MSDFGELGEGGLEVFMISAAMMSGSSAGRARVAAASFTAGGTETLSVPREAGHRGLIHSWRAILRIQSKKGWRCLRGTRL